MKKILNSKEIKLYANSFARIKLIQSHLSDDQNPTYKAESQILEITEAKLRSIFVENMSIEVVIGMRPLIEQRIIELMKEKIITIDDHNKSEEITSSISSSEFNTLFSFHS